MASCSIENDTFMQKISVITRKEWKINTNSDLKQSLLCTLNLLELN